VSDFIITGASRGIGRVTRCAAFVALAAVACGPPVARAPGQADAIVNDGVVVLWNDVLELRLLGAEAPTELRVLDLPIPEATLAGTVAGSPAVVGNVFLGAETGGAAGGAQGETLRITSGNRMRPASATPEPGRTARAASITWTTVS
jgi:hypothetical protein